MFVEPRMRPEQNTAKWSRTEDQILLAGVMKYGFTKWSKVAALLSRTPAQCRQRYEDALASNAAGGDAIETLRLCRIFPSQYRLIGGILGASAARCYSMHSTACLGYDISSKKTKSIKSSSEVEDQYLLEFARARIENTRSRKDLKRIRRRQ